MNGSYATFIRDHVSSEEVNDAKGPCKDIVRSMENTNGSEGFNKDTESANNFNLSKIIFDNKDERDDHNMGLVNSSVEVNHAEGTCKDVDILVENTHGFDGFNKEFGPSTIAPNNFNLSEIIFDNKDEWDVHDDEWTIPITKEEHHTFPSNDHDNTYEVHIVNHILVAETKGKNWRCHCIFHTLMASCPKTSQVIVDSNSCVNAISQAFILDSNLQTEVDPQPYKVSLLNSDTLDVN
ncbi:hypothetical protein NE237_001844 [Protea cynaroides]|uniref:Uncharacterized protein n=1 Tax=Protea cynaroides TaxID=273540 RepID=A0A9Q0QYH7_9MAGN|nr:hypothetical protein NE237_001844 [Protea cynaroides]